MSNEEKDFRKERRRKKEERMRQVKRVRLYIISGCMVAALLTGLIAGWFIRGLFIKEPVNPSEVVAPDWIDQQFITKNPYSRPGDKVYKINNIVVHYIGNAGTTAQQNRDYFDSLKNQSGGNTTSVSSNFIIGMDGEIIQCIPIDEKAYASNNRNSDTVSIECCHPSEDGEFTEETYNALVKLTSWLCEELDLSEKDIIRHYDVTGKACPKYFVDHEDAWKSFLKDVKKAMK